VSTEPLTPAQRRRLLPWYDHVDWLSNPRLAYAKGLQDGYELGHTAASREVVAVLAEALGGTGCTDYRQGVRRHFRVLDAKARRAACDQGEAVNRGAQRRAA
jgi:hypothetical protein